MPDGLVLLVWSFLWGFLKCVWGVAGVTSCVLCTSKLNLENDGRTRHAAGTTWRQTDLVSTKWGDSRDGSLVWWLREISRKVFWKEPGKRI